MIAIPQDEIHYFRNLTGFIGRAVYIEDRNRPGQCSGIDASLSDKLFVNESARSTRVDQGVDIEVRCGVGRFNFDRNNEGAGVGTGIGASNGEVQR